MRAPLTGIVGFWYFFVVVVVVAVEGLRQDSVWEVLSSSLRELVWKELTTKGFRELGTYFTLPYFRIVKLQGYFSDFQDFHTGPKSRQQLTMDNRVIIQDH